LDIRGRDEKVGDESSNKHTGPAQDGKEGVRLRLAEPVLFAIGPPHRRRLLNESDDRHNFLEGQRRLIGNFNTRFDLHIMASYREVV